MEKRGRKFQFNVNMSNRLYYTLILIGILIVGAWVVIAYGTSNPSTFGHSAGELAPPTGCASGQVLSWSGSAWSCVNNTGSGSSGGEALKKKTTLYKTTSCTTQPWCADGTKSLGAANIITTESSAGYSSSCLNTWGDPVTVSCTASNTFIGYSVDAVIYNNYSQSFNTGSAILNCLSGENIVSGGQTGCPGEADETLKYNGISGNGWRVECSDYDGGGVSFTISITCAK